MSYWILTIDSLMNTFSTTESRHDIKYRIQLDSLRSESALFEEMKQGDNILGYVNDPVEKISYVFEVLGKDDDHYLVLRKTHELFYGLSLYRIEKFDEWVYSQLTSINEQPLIKITREQYIILFSSLFYDVYQLVKEDIEEYASAEDGASEGTEEKMIEPEKDPKADELSHNRIIFGSPGTGKSFGLEEDRISYFGSFFERVTFHPSFSYSQFFGTYKPRPKNDGSDTITYELVPGPLLRILAKALKHRKRNYLLIIEEINRANTAETFGDIFQLLDRKDSEDADGEARESQYRITISKEIEEFLNNEAGETLVNREIYLPSNLYIWATMNTADQGVYPIDSAFKRRFDFEYIGINENESIMDGYEIEINGFGSIEWNDFRRTLNEFLMENMRNMKEDKLIGPFFFSKKILNGTKDKFQKIFQNKLLMYLAEDVLKTNKTLLFNYPSFSMTAQIYKEGKENVFSTEFTSRLEKYKK